MKSFGRNYVDPKRQATGLAGEVFRDGYATVNILSSGTGPQGEVEVRFLGDLYKPETQRVQLKQVAKPFAAFTWIARWNNDGIAETIRVALASVEALRLTRTKVRNSQ